MNTKGLRHGDLYRDGDEFNREPWYYCAKCGGNHSRDFPACDGLRVAPYSWERPPVPTGYVPRVEYQPPLRRSQVAREAVLGAALPLTHSAAIQRAVDDYLLMERKARAWDGIWEIVNREAPSLSRDAWVEIEKLNALVHPAQPSAPADR